VNVVDNGENLQVQPKRIALDEMHTTGINDQNLAYVASQPNLSPVPSRVHAHLLTTSSKIQLNSQEPNDMKQLALGSKKSTQLGLVDEEVDESLKQRDMVMLHDGRDPVQNHS
jgi:hypothetical protein